MKFVVKHLIRFFLFVVLATVVFEIGLANCEQSKKQNYSDTWSAFHNHMNATSDAINYSIQTAIEGNWEGFTLIRYFLFAFHNRVIWIVAALLVLISYYELRSRQVEPNCITPNQKIAPTKYEKEKEELTTKELFKLVKSEAFKKYKQEKENEVIDVEKEEKVDEEFLKDWEQNEETIFSE